MSVYLLDINVLISLSWPGHKFHEVVQRWFARHATGGWATCPIVETGFVRILSNPAYSPRALTPTEAIEALATNARHPGHQFWPDDVKVADGFKHLQDRVVGHQQVTDAYLVALAIRHRGKLATLDQGIAQFAPAGSVELVS